MKSNLIDVARVRDVLSYDAATGLLRWKLVKRGGQEVGAVAGHINKQRGYVHVRVDGVLYKGHRLAWAIHYGEQPPKVIDHANGDTSDNRIENLRGACQSYNSGNRRMSSNNTTGYKGVYLDRSGKFRAQGKKYQKVAYLGMHKTSKDAAEAYNLWAVEAFGEFARLNTWQRSNSERCA
jgi:hypothetical protein